MCFNEAAVEHLPADLVDMEVCVLSDEIKNNLIVINEKDGDMLDKMVAVMTEVKSAK